MDRKQFFGSACKLGFCGCASMMYFTVPNAKANTRDEEEKTDWRIGFMQKRFAKLINTMDSNLDESQKNMLLENMGRECAKEYIENFLHYKGDIEGFLGYVKEKWADKTEFNKEKKEIVIIGKKKERCFCPFVSNAITPQSFCSCSMGWQKEMYEMVTEQNVEVILNTSILQGDESCNSTIKLL